MEYRESVYVGYRYYDKAHHMGAVKALALKAVRQAQHHHGYIRTPGGLHGLGDQRLIHAALGLVREGRLDETLVDVCAARMVELALRVARNTKTTYNPAGARWSTTELELTRAFSWLLAR